jgi:D-3-phosphoglycerate dehydrogenase
VNVPDYCWDEVADHTFALLLACARTIPALHQRVRQGYFGWAAVVRPLHRLRGQTLGIVGLGHIGRGVALRAQAFGLRVLANDPLVSEQQAAEVGAKLVGLDELLRASDYVTLHVPLNQHTYHFINERRLRQMKPSAVLINTCRGGVVDQAALVKALREGWIAGAGLDVFEEEPLPPDSPLRGLENVILTPHLAWYSEESLAELHRKAAQEIVRFFRGEPLRYRVN